MIHHILKNGQEVKDIKGMQVYAPELINLLRVITESEARRSVTNDDLRKP